MSKAVIFFAPGLEECEGLLCVDLLRRSGVEVTIAAVGGEKIVKSARSISVVADALAEELDYSAFDAAILPGGIPGVDNLKADATVRKVCTEFAAAGKVVAAICAALGFVPVLEQVALSLTLLVDVLSLVGLITALRRRVAPLPFIGLLVARFHPF